MATTNGTWNFYNTFFLYAFTVMNLATDTFKMKLTTSTHTPAATDSTVSDLDNEVSGNGYAEQTLGSVSYTQTSGVGTFDFTNPVFNASGGDWSARNFHIYDDTTTTPADALVGWGLLDDTPGDVTVTNGNTLTYNVHANGQFTAAAA